MNNELKEIDIKNLDSNKIKINEKSYKNILIYYIGCMTIKGLSYVKINSVNSLYLIKDKINGYTKNGYAKKV